MNGKRGSIVTEGTRVFKSTVSQRRGSAAVDGATSSRRPFNKNNASDAASPRPTPPRVEPPPSSTMSSRRPRVRQQRSISLTTKPEARLLAPFREEAADAETNGVEALKRKVAVIKQKIKDKGLSEEEGKGWQRSAICSFVHLFLKSFSCLLGFCSCAFFSF